MTSSSCSRPSETPHHLNLVKSTMAASTSREENLARMGLEKFVQTTIVAEQLDNTLLHAQGQLNHTLTELQTLPAKVSERIALCIRFGIHVTPAKVESIIANHLRFKKKHLQKELCLIDENRQKLLKDLEQFPKLAERVFTQHDYCDRGNLSTSYNLSTWFMLDDSSWSQLYDHRDIFSDSVSIPTTLKPYEPWRKEMDCSPRDDCLKDWPEYRYQRQYPEPTQIAAFEQDDDEEEIKDMRTDKEIKDDDSASPSGLLPYTFKHDSF